MSLYPFHMEQIQCSAGQKVRVSAAFHKGEKLYLEYFGVTCDYTKKSGVIDKKFVHKEPEC